MGTVGNKIHAFKMELARPVKTARAATLNRKNELTLKLLGVLEQHAAREDKIFSNESLSEQGKQQALRKLGVDETAPTLKWIQNVVKDLQEADQKYRSRFFEIDAGIKDPAERMPLFVYLWRKFDALTTNERIKRFSQAAERNEVVTMAAMLEHPEGSLVDEEVKERALIERAKRLTPQQVENFEQNAILLEYMTMMHDWIGRWLYGEVGVEIAAIRSAFGDELADALTQQATGIPVQADPQPVGA